GQSRNENARLVKQLTAADGRFIMRNCLNVQGKGHAEPTMKQLESSNGACADLVSTMRINRRRFLQVGHLGLWTCGLLKILAGQAEAMRDPGKRGGGARGCIILFQPGGQYQCETYDPKPQAPADVRGIFKTIQTPVVGMHMTEGLQQVAKHTGKF